MRDIIELHMQQQQLIMFVVILLHLLCFSCTKIAASDMITKDQQISDGQTIVSAKRMFELGFFSPGNSTNRYVGIWYKNISVQTVVWVANRERPVTDLTGVLMVNNEGALVIMDSKGNSILIGYGSGSGTNNNTSARLLDDGNLILGEGDLDKNGRVLWQSFDYPTNSFLPGMKLGRDLKSKRNRLLTSWTSPEDPSPGIFTAGMDPNGTELFFIWNLGVIYWSNGKWNGRTFSLIPERSLNYFRYINNKDEQSFSYSVPNSSVPARLVLDISGQLKQVTWLEKPGEWNVFWKQPKDFCDVFSSCGAYSSCNPDNKPPCQCLPGFEPVSPKDWESNNWSDGCARSTNLKCGNEDGFLQLTRMKLPDQMQNVNGMGQDATDCEAMCMKNCSCIAYTPVNKAGCLLWDTDLFSIREDYGEQDLFIRLAAAELGKDKPLTGKNKARLWAIVVVAVVLALLLSGFFLFYLWRRKLKRRGAESEEEDKIFKELGTYIGPARKFNNASTYEGDTNDSDLQFFSFASIGAATDNFSPVNKLGQGGFGPVYKGKLLDGREIAVKRLSIRSRQGLEEFKNEILLIAKLQHRNLVRLFGCCIQTEEKILIYEYMPNNSLDSFLFDSTKRGLLDWAKRVHIIEGIAQGILYLHKHSRLRVIHRDLKAGNILLDGDMNPKISDFGMARIFENDESEANTKRVVGTYGYMSPEYAMEGIFSTKSDVFSFGVLLLEILSGKKTTSFNHSECSSNLLGYAWKLWKDDKGMELIDPTLINSVSAHDFMKYMNVGLLCVQESPIDRPMMQEVISMLTGGSGSVLPVPKQAAFFISRSAVETDGNPGTGDGSVNELTVSLMEAR